MIEEVLVHYSDVSNRKSITPLLETCTVNDRYSGDRYSGNDGFSGTKPLDDAILFTNSGITALVELFLGKF